jgi:hypothetical protein
VIPPSDALPHCGFVSPRRPRRNGYSVTLHVNPIERAALVNRLRKPGMTDDEVDEIVRVVEAYLSRRLCAADWRMWLRRRADAASRPAKD